ncbi:MAG: hypothetical protein ABI700_26190, partial [Chloroflexota bacterium]
MVNSEISLTWKSFRPVNSYALFPLTVMLCFSRFSQPFVEFIQNKYSHSEHLMLKTQNCGELRAEHVG